MSPSEAKGELLELAGQSGALSSFSDADLDALAETYADVVNRRERADKEIAATDGIIRTFGRPVELGP